jgi:hypothetical protein
MTRIRCQRLLLPNRTIANFRVPPSEFCDAGLVHAAPASQGSARSTAQRSAKLRCGGSRWCDPPTSRAKPSPASELFEPRLGLSSLGLAIRAATGP